MKEILIIVGVFLLIFVLIALGRFSRRVNKSISMLSKAERTDLKRSIDSDFYKAKRNWLVGGSFTTFPDWPIYIFLLGAGFFLLISILNG